MRLKSPSSLAVVNTTSAALRPRQALELRIGPRVE
jgi:hypothetical protein